jgi:hypothetical protein
VTNIVIDMVLIGAVAFFVAKQRGKQRAIIPSNGPEIGLEQRPEAPARREPPALARAGTTAPATASTQIPAPAGSPHYLLGDRRAGARRDRMAETLAMMSGPGICTPTSR